MQQIRTIVQKYHSDVKAVLQSSSAAADKKSQVSDLKTKAAADINAVLTPDQQTKAQQSGIIAKILNIRAAIARGIKEALSQLDLTADQKTQIKAIFQDDEAQAKAVRQDTTLTADAKQAKIAAIWKATREKVMAVLTPAQQQQLQQIMQERHGNGTGSTPQS